MTMKKICAILLFAVNSLTYNLGLGFLFGEDDENSKLNQK